MAEKDIGAGESWTDEIRTALIGSDVVLLLLTQRSKDRPWILVEAGAGWAMSKKLVPILNQVSAADLIEPLARHQARIVETAGQRRALAKELAARRSS
jgi:hypothetical protein